MTDRELMKQALDALEFMSGDEFLCNAAHHNKKDMHKIGDSCPVAARYKATRETLRARLAQPEQRIGDCLLTGVCAAEGHRIQKPQREWQGLTDEEIEALRHIIDWTAHWSYGNFARAIEAKLKEKNS